jgi:hypothetical protein
VTIMHILTNEGIVKEQGRMATRTHGGCASTLARGRS